MTIPSQPKQPTMPSEEILLKVSNDPNVALQQVILDELNRMHARIIKLEAEVASLKQSTK